MHVNTYDADFLARYWHADQVDKAGAPYIQHPQRVARMVAAAGWPKQYVAAAVLHDVIEDTDCTVEELRRRGFDEAIVTAVEALTRRTTSIDDPTTKEGYLSEFIPRIAANRIATVVKVFDLLDNLSPLRGHVHDESQHVRYTTALKTLMHLYPKLGEEEA